MKLGAGLAVMETESDKILDIFGLKNSIMAREQAERMEQSDMRYATLAGEVARFIDVEEEKIRTQRVELSDLEPLKVAIQRKAPSSTAQMSAVGLVGGATEEESGERPHVLSQPITHEVREDEMERPAP